MPTYEEVVSSTANVASGYGYQILASLLPSTLAVASTVATQPVLVVTDDSLTVGESVTANAAIVLRSTVTVSAAVVPSRTNVAVVASSAAVAGVATPVFTAVVADAAVIADAMTFKEVYNISDSVAVSAAIAGLSFVEDLASAVRVAEAVRAATTLSFSGELTMASALGQTRMLIAESDAAAVTGTLTMVRSAVESAASALEVDDSFEMHLTAQEALGSTGVFESFLRLPASAVQSYWTNTRTMAAAKWDALTVTSVVEKDGVLYGATTDGVHELVAAGGHEGEVVWDLMNFGSPQQKVVDSVYLNGTAGGPLTVRVANEDGGWEYTTHLTAPTTKNTNHRATLGRGLKAVDYRISVKADVAFDISDVHLQIAEAKRRIGG